MYVHIALYKWKPSVSATQIEHVLASISSINDKVPGIIEISCAKNTSKHGNSYTHVILVRAESKDAIDAYRNHPDHTKAAKEIDAIEDSGIGVDFVT